MSTSSSIASVMAWNWVVQSLASFKQVDSSTLAGVVKEAPALSDDLGKDSREMVSLRTLESLFIHGDEDVIDTHSTQNPKISFDPSERCEDVLHRILEEKSEPMTELERQKWNVRPFVMHKMASLRKSPLQKLKEELFEVSHPLCASLKERSNLDGTNLPENSQNTFPEVNVDSDDQTTVSKDDLASMNPANESNKLPKSPLQKPDDVDNSTRGNTEHINGKENEMPEEPLAKGLEENMLMDHNDQTANESNKLPKSPLQKPDDVDNSTRGNTEHIRGKENEIPEEPLAKGLEENMLMDHNDQTPSKKLEQSSGIDHGQQELTGQDTCRKEQEERMPTGNFTDPKNDNLPTISNSKPSNDGRYVENTDNEKSDDEMTDIAAMKEAFLNSQYTLSEDSMATIDSTEITLCMKCNKGGHLSVCSSDSCQLRVHSRCLSLTTTLDKNGKFFCPFCAYSHAISEYLQVKEKASLARKDLQAFISSGVKHRPNVPSEKGAGLDKNKSTQTGEKDKVNINGPTVSRDKEDYSPNGHADIHLNNEVLDQHKQKCNEEESDVSSRSRRCREQKPQYTSPAIPLARRNKLRWTNSEVEILKEGVQRFSGNDDNRGIPWRDILDFGREVFHKGRTTIDLKDKWRNICKGSPAKKKQKV